MPEAKIDLEFSAPKVSETVALPKMIDDEGHVLADVEFPTPSISDGTTVAAVKTVNAADVSKKVVSTTDKK